MTHYLDSHCKTLRPSSCQRGDLLYLPVITDDSFRIYGPITFIIPHEEW